jgi:hypothetical protein
MVLHGVMKVPAFPRYSCSFYPPPHTYNPSTQLLSHPPKFSACHTLMAYLPNFPRSALLALFSINVKYACPVSNWLTVFSQTANGNWSVVLQFPPVSYINLSFPQADCSTACYMLVSCWFILQPWQWKQMFLQNIGWLSMNYTVPYPRRQSYS